MSFTDSGYYPENTYGISGLFQTQTDINGNVTSYTYDNKGNVLTTTQYIDGVNRVTRNTYDEQGRLTKTVDPNGICTENLYNAMGKIMFTSVSDQDEHNVQITRTVHDALGRVIQEISPLDYNAEKDNLDADNYSDSTVGDRTEYNALDQIISEKDPMGNETKYEYDNDGNIQKEIQPNGSYYTYVYDKDGRKTRESFTDNYRGAVTVLRDISYTEGKNEIKTTDYIESGLDATTTEEYNWEGKLIKKTSPNNAVQTITYKKGLITEETLHGYLTKYSHDSWGRVISKTSSFEVSSNQSAINESKTLYTYDNYGNVLTELVKNNAEGQPESFSKKKFSYDSQNRLVRTTLYEGSTTISCTQSYYSWDGKLMREYKGLSEPLTINGLDNIGNPYNQDYSVIKYEYDTMGRLNKKTDALGQIETYKYDKENQQIYMKDRKGIEHTVKYDKNGNSIEKVSGSITKKYIYDCMDNLTSEKEDNKTSIYVYDGSGNILNETTGNVQKIYTYNYADMVTSQTIKVGGVQKQQVTNTYDNMGNLVAVYEDGTLKASYTYDLSSRLKKTINANGTTEEIRQNLAGLVTSTTNRKGDEILSIYEYTYYFDGKESTKTDSTGTTTYIYDGKGELIKEVVDSTSGNGNTAMDKAIPIDIATPKNVNINKVGLIRYYSFTPATTGTYIIESMCSTLAFDPCCYLYSSDGTQLAYNVGIGYSNFKIEYTLTAGERYIIGATMYSVSTFNYNFKVTKKYDGENTTLEKAEMVAAEKLTSINIDTAGQMRYYSFTPTITDTYIITSTNNSGDPVGHLYSLNGTQLAYNDDGNGNRNFKIKYKLTAGTVYVVGARMFSSGTGYYNLAITSQSGGSVVQEYSYDANGNRTKLKETKDGDVTETNYTYDKNDRLLTEETGTEATVTYSYDDNGNMIGKTDGTVQTYDALNRITSYKKSNGTATTYTYYPNDMRESKKTGTATETTHVWIDDEIALDLSGSTVISSYIHGDKLITGAYGWYLYNAHGDVTALTDSSGNITRNYEYDSFGVQRTSVDANDNNPYRYCGEYYDTESGYTYLQARYYDPNTGRFVSEDPAFDGNNWYVYCENDPVNMIDPTGIWSGKVHEDITEAAYKAVKSSLKRYKTAKVALINGCTYQDRVRESKPYYKNGRWHGHGKYKRVMQAQREKAKNIWNSKKKNKYKKAYFEIGKGLHTLQDYYAHNVKLNGKWVSSRKVADKKFEVVNGELVPEVLEQYMDNKFINACINGGYKIKKGKGVHAVTADNPNAYFNGTKWV